TMISVSAAGTLTVHPTVTTSYWATVDRGGCVSRTTDSVVNVCIPTITTPASGPANPINSGSPATLTVAANTAGVSYQWYTGASGDTPHPIAGAPGTSYAATPASTTSYWVLASSTCGNANSATMTVSVCAPPAIKTSPQNAQIYSNGTATLSVTATEA